MTGAPNQPTVQPMTAEDARHIRQTLFALMAGAIGGALMAPGSWKGVCAFAALAAGAAFFAMDRRQVRKVWRRVYEERAQSMTIAVALAVSALALVLVAAGFPA
jgi:hypothetical protein